MANNADTYARAAEKMGLGTMRNIGSLLGIRGVSRLRVCEIADKVRAVLLDKEYIAEIIGKLNLDNRDYDMNIKRIIGKRLQRLENALGLPNDLSEILLQSSERDYAREQAMNEALANSIFDDVKSIVMRLQSENPDVEKIKIHTAFRDVLDKLGY